MRAGTIWDAVRAGHPAVITVGVMLVLAAVVVVYLVWGRRPVMPKPGALTVAVLKARLAKEAVEVQPQRRVARETGRRTRSQTDAGYADGLVVGSVESALPDDPAEKTDVLPAVVPGEPRDVLPVVTVVWVPEPRRPSRNRPYAGLKPGPRPALEADLSGLSGHRPRSSPARTEAPSACLATIGAIRGSADLARAVSSGPPSSAAKAQIERDFCPLVRPREQGIA